ncbi:CHAT domain-containing protein [Dactylosporangium sp. NPDC005555]|uniref:CHAT domain-containing protein n=1 Tax=Dactylosporangium sp. NPDC005555 TaxID=3154889 RepID=UPI0033A45C0B
MRHRQSDRINVDLSASATLTELAEQALALRQRDPRAAIALAERVLAARDRDPGQCSVAERAIGLARKELNDLAGAQRHLRRAVAAGQRSGSGRTLAMAQMSLGYVLAAAGRTTAAHTAVTASLTRLTGSEAGQALMQRGVVQYFRGRYVEAAEDYSAAIDVAVREGDALLEARARNNRAILPAGVRDRGDGAAADLDRAASIFAGLGLDLAAADCRWNAGHLAAQHGDVPGALAVFADAEREYRRLSVPRPALILDRFELLAAVPLVREAADTAALAVRELREHGLVSDLAEALLAGARAALLLGDPDGAAASAAAARARFQRQGRRAWSAFARTVELRAQYMRGIRTAALLTSLTRNAGRLEAAGWLLPAATAWVEAAQVALALDDPARARRLLARAAAYRRGGVAGQRVRGWLAVALLHRLDGADRAAASALRRGLAVLDEHRAVLGATQVRAGSSVHGHDLAAEGLDIALAGRRPGPVLAWAERWRATTLWSRTPLPPQDPRRNAVLAELRETARAAEDALLAGRRAEGLLRRQSALEARVRELDLRTAGGDAGAAPAVTVRAVADELGRAVLVELVSHRGALAAVVVRDGRATLHDLGPLPAVLAQVRRSRFALRRLITLGESAGARSGLADAVARLDRQLFDPVRDRLGDRPLVVVPGGALHTVPWSALPTGADRPVTVAPSAAVWCRAVRQPAPSGPAVLIAGPRLPEAATEVAALAAVWPGATVLTGPRATVAAVTAAFSGAGLVHVAAHGAFRADNPLFSTLALADGPLFAYELERLPRSPGCVVASACETGLADARLGDELMGFAAVLLAQGTRTLIAAMLPVPADRTAALMVHLHRLLRAGEAPAPALGAAQAALRAGGDPRDVATAAAFACLGAG